MFASREFSFSHQAYFCYFLRAQFRTSKLTTNCQVSKYFYSQLDKAVLILSLVFPPLVGREGFTRNRNLKHTHKLFELQMFASNMLAQRGQYLILSFFPFYCVASTNQFFAEIIFFLPIIVDASEIVFRSSSNVDTLPTPCTVTFNAIIIVHNLISQKKKPKQNILFSKRYGLWYWMDVVSVQSSNIIQLNASNEWIMRCNHLIDGDEWVICLNCCHCFIHRAFSIWPSCINW